MPRKMVVPWTQYPDDVIASIQIDWQSLEHCLNLNLSQRYRYYIFDAVKFYAIERNRIINADTPSEYKRKLDLFETYISELHDISNSDRFISLRTALGNRPERFDWDGFSFIIEDLIERSRLAQDFFADKSRTFDINYLSDKSFIGLIGQMRDLFLVLNISVKVSKNINRNSSVFVSFCFALMRSLPKSIQKHSSSEITFASAVSDVLKRLSRHGRPDVGELRAWLDEKPPPP
jgi:hypothetical protein